MNPATAWCSNFRPSPWSDFQNTMTSACTLIVAVSNDLASAVVLVASGLTNAASLLDTRETLQLRANSVSQITSSSAQLLQLRTQSKDVASVPHDTSDSHTAAAISELRLSTDFTWDQIARLFSVSRRSVHFWASGEPMSRENEEHLHRVLGIVKHSDRGRTGDNRAALLFPNGPSAVCAFDLLMARDYANASLALGTSDGLPQRDHVRFVPSLKVLNERAPLPPDILAAGLQDGGAPAPRKARAARYRKVAREP